MYSIVRFLYVPLNLAQTRKSSQSVRRQPKNQSRANDSFVA